jgi:hypothetical protein
MDIYGLLLYFCEGQREADQTLNLFNVTGLHPAVFRRTRCCLGSYYRFFIAG